MTVDMNRFRRIQEQNALLCERKNRAYGDGNLLRFGPRGVVVRMADKMERLINLVWNHASEDQETLVDTARDLANYATILQQLVEDGDLDGGGGEPEGAVE